ncbi:MAG: 5-formyltetrahydrofolate cyclo-ligase [Clostridiales bacterium]|jgi:5-formyltetrahydrofolate cyclo-ligase|nr:5-formyltetrahydrofolate cyclo-ligase [Clostridiales bacterium]
MREDIRPIKARLREYYKNLRQQLSQERKAELDREIIRRVTGLWQYGKSRLLLTYVSTKTEIDTLPLIDMALAEGKTVAVPRCVEGTRNIEFYRISSISELSPGTFGVLEPDPEVCKKVINFTNSLCLVPALCYDWKGYRLGYGKGYYDRFLEDYNGTIVGIAYSNCVRPSLPHGRFDRPVELIVTDSFLRRTSRR